MQVRLFPFGIHTCTVAYSNYHYQSYPLLLKTIRMSSTTSGKGSSEPIFDSSGRAALYKQVAKAHYHPDGPFKRMTEKAVETISLLESISNPIVVDLASGQGEPAMSIAKLVPNATVFSTDISVDMHAAAVNAALSIPNMVVKIADMQNLSPLFEDNSVDIVTVCYGYMFPPDKMKALNETYRVLKPGGTLIATTWNRLQMFELVEELFQEVLSTSFNRPAVFDPLSLSEPGLFEKMLVDAGFSNKSIHVSTHEYPFDFTSDPEFLVAAVRMTDAENCLEQVEPALLKAKIMELAQKKLVVQDDGVFIAPRNVYKFVTVKK